MSSISRFRFIMIKPTRYDSDGYPYRWVRSLTPSNSLAAVNSLALDCAKRGALGEGVSFEFENYDEINCKVPIKRIIRDAKDPSSRTLIGMIGVQSNMYPRAVDLSRPFLEAGLPVMIGGFHVSGCLSMLDEMPAELQEALDLGISFFAGEAEDGRLDEVFADAMKGELKPIYNYLNDLPSLEGKPSPILEPEIINRTLGCTTSFDLGRGCPFNCSFCTIINVQGRKSRFRSPDDLEEVIRDNASRGIHRFFITDDNFARNRRWEELLDRMILLREEKGFEFDSIIQVDTQCHKLPNFIEKCKRAGVCRVFIGLENINPDNLQGSNKGHNKITEYRTMFQAWRDQGIFTYAGYIIGFENDTQETILRDIAIVQKELCVDLLQFTNLVPLPGSADHKNMLADGTWMDDDLNKYNLHERVTHHPKMSDDEWDETSKLMWSSYYTYEHIETVARRHAVRSDREATRIIRFMLNYKQLAEIEGTHPLEGGVFRLKPRTERRPGLPIENPLVFYPKFAWEVLRKIGRYYSMYRKCAQIEKRVLSDPNRRSYMDVAIEPVAEQDKDNLALFTETTGGLAAVHKVRRQEEIKKRALVQAAE